MKRVFPAFWFVFLIFFLVAGGFGGAWKDPMFIVMPVLMSGFGFFMFRKLVWDLADEVQDGGDFLIVRRGGIEARVQLSEVMNVSISQFANPRRLTLRLRKPGELGDEIAFIPKSAFQFNPFARNAVAERLMMRVDRLRNSG